MSGQKQPAAGVVGSAEWIPINKVLPQVGQIIACRAAWYRGGWMFWAGKVVRVDRGFATMEIKDTTTHRFIITYDTCWCLLPNTRPATVNDIVK